MWWWGLLFGCGSFDVELPTDKAQPPEKVALTRAHDLVEHKAETMQASMIQELGAKSPGEAIQGTSAEPDSLAWHAASVPTEQGHVGISALKLRNPANRPPPWVQTWLQAHEGAEFADVESVEQIVDTPNGKVARVLQPIPMLEQCVRCHGKAEQIPADVRTEIERRYPHDQSIGYEVGDLRGAVWAEVAVGDG